jgi:hypothetical protein
MYFSWKDPDGKQFTKLFPTMKQAFSDLGSPKERDFNHKKKEYHLPNGFLILLGDVGGGSKTPNLVKQVLAWKSDLEKNQKLGLFILFTICVYYHILIISSIYFNKEKKFKLILTTFFFVVCCLVGSAWDLLVEFNSKTIELFEQLTSFSTLNNKSFDQLRERLASLPPPRWKEAVTSESDSQTVQLLLDLRFNYIQARRNFALLGCEDGNSLNSFTEPISQKILSDETMDLPGVLIAGVPGGIYFLFDFIKQKK